MVYKLGNDKDMDALPPLDGKTEEILFSYTSVRQENGKPLTPDVMSQKWRRFIAAHDLPSIRFHDLRHSNATALIQAGVNPKVVQQRLGHADVSVTLNTYTHVLPEMDIEAADKLDAIMLTGRKKVGAGA